MVVNFFSKVTVDEDGRFHLFPPTAAPEITLSCFAPMDVLMVLTALPHPQDPGSLSTPAANPAELVPG